MNSITNFYQYMTLIMKLTQNVEKSSCERYDFHANQWFESPAMTVERSDHALVVHGGTMYAIGGMGRFQTHDSIEEFNTEVTIFRFQNRIYTNKCGIFLLQNY